MANDLAKPPVPDPTILTTQQLDKAIECLREIHEARFDGMDTAIKLLQAEYDRLPVLQQAAIDNLEKLHNEKFNSVSAQIEILLEGVRTQFLERDKRTEQLSLADKTAIAAALQAQKEAAGSTTEMIIAAITKMEGNFTKLIDQSQVTLQAGLKNADEKINDVKSRIDKGEGRTSGVTESDVARARHSGMIVGLVGMGLAIATLALLAFRVVT